MSTADSKRSAFLSVGSALGDVSLLMASIKEHFCCLDATCLLSMGLTSGYYRTGGKEAYGIYSGYVPVRYSHI